MFRKLRNALLCVALLPTLAFADSTFSRVDVDGEGLIKTGRIISLELDGASLTKSATGLKLTAIGSDTQVTFNDAGTMAGDTGLVFNKTTDDLTVLGAVIGGCDETTNKECGLIAKENAGGAAAGIIAAGERGILPQADGWYDCDDTGTPVCVNIIETLYVYGFDTDVTLSDTGTDGAATVTADNVVVGIFNASGLQLGSGDATDRLILPQSTDFVTPTISFGDGDSGIYESGDDTIVFSLLGGTDRFEFVTGGEPSFRALATGGPGIMNEGATNLNPTLIPDITDADTGVGQAAADQLSLIAGGDEFLRGNVGATGVTYVNITPGATGVGPTIAAAGEANLDLILAPNGTGQIDINLDCSAGDQYLTTNAAGQISCGTDNDSGGATAIDALGDAGAGDDAVALAADGQTWSWDMAADAALDSLTLSLQNDQVTDTTTQRILSLVRPDSAGEHGDVEIGLRIENLDTTDPIVSAIEIRGATGGGITNAIDANDADITTIINTVNAAITDADLQIIDDSAIDLGGTGGLGETSNDLDPDRIAGDTTDDDALDDAAIASLPLTGGDVTTSGANATIQAGVVEETMMSTEDFGDFSCGAAADDCLLDAGVVDSAALVAAHKTDEKCVLIESPVSSETFLTLHRFPYAATGTAIYCETVGGTSVVAQWQKDDGTPANIDSNSMSCDSAGATDASMGGDASFAIGDRLDLVLGTVTGSVTDLSICLRWTID